MIFDDIEVELDAHYGNDLDVVNIAKVSFGKEVKELGPKETRLIHFLASGLKAAEYESLYLQTIDVSDREEAISLIEEIRKISVHWTPFAHNYIRFRIVAPVPIARQMFKHKIGFVENEESRRYISTPPKFYNIEYFRSAAANVKQGSTDEPHEFSKKFEAEYQFICKEAYDTYNQMIEEGVCPEQARFVLPQGMMVTWFLSGNLYSFSELYNKRSDPHAQREIQYLARRIGEELEPLFPVSWEALTTKVRK